MSQQQTLHHPSQLVNTSQAVTWMLLMHCCPAESKVQGLLWVNPSMEPPVLKVVLGEQCLSKKVTSFWSESKAPRTETNH